MGQLEPAEPSVGGSLGRRVKPIKNAGNGFNAAADKVIRAK